MRVYISISLIFLGILSNTMPRWPSIIHFTGDEFCLWQAASFVFIGLAALLKGSTKIENASWVFLVVLAYNNYYDERWGRAIHPTRSQLFAEVIIGAVALIWITYKIVKWIKQRQ
jgi:predicted membrane protein